MTDPARSREHPVVATARPDFNALYRDEFSFVYRVLRYHGVRDADIEDLVHDVFVVLHRRLDDYDPARPIRPWLFGIAYRTARRHGERVARRSEVSTEVPGAESREPAADEQLEAARAWRTLQRTLQELPWEQRAVVISHDIEEHTAPEIAVALDVPLNTVYSRLRLGRKKLSVLLRRRGRAP